MASLREERMPLDTKDANGAPKVDDLSALCIGRYATSGLDDDELYCCRSTTRGVASR